MKRPEILAPAGGMEQLIAAVRCGADAVYVGTDGFNARQNAKNFGADELIEAVSYCHARNVAVHVTLNTLIFDSELDKLIETVKIIAQSGADAVIVQDAAVIKILKEYCPDIALHASTQMTIHNSAGVRAAQKLGFDRAVLARELTFDEIKTITKSASIETEVFVHGALCTCVSGICYLSSMLGGRSGNRGYCAQPCRLNFKNSHNREYALSLKDMSLIENVNKLCDAGVSSFKIEGRMKRPEYVAAAVTALRSTLDGEKPDMKLLENIFSRSGFTDGYAADKRDVSMYGYRRKEDVEASANVLGGIAALYKNERQSVPVDMEITVKPQKNIELTVTDGKFYVTESGDIPEKAINRPIDEEYIKKFMSKTGGTPFYADSLRTYIEGDVAVSASQLNQLRRVALEELLQQRSALVPHDFFEKRDVIEPHKCVQPYKIRLRFENYAQIPQKFDCDAEKIILPIQEILPNNERIQNIKQKLIAEIPVLLWENDCQKLAEQLEKLKSFEINDVMCSNIGAVEIAKEYGFTIHGGVELNILNSIALTEYKAAGLSDALLSFELGMNGIKSLRADIKRGIIGYGYLPLMRLRTCPAKGVKGCGDCNGRPYLTDRTGVKFPLMCKGKRYTELLNSVPLYVGDKNIAGVDFVVLYFTTEDSKEVGKIIRTFNENSRYDEPHTNGLYYRTVM